MRLCAIRANTKQVAALRYVWRRQYIALKRRGLSLASQSEVEALNTLKLLIDSMMGQQLLFK